MMINMIIKIVIFDIFTQVPGQTTILAGFAAFFYADSCRRYVKSSFLSPFQDHFCFPQKSLSTSTSMFFCFLSMGEGQTHKTSITISLANLSSTAVVVVDVFMY